MRILHTSDWHIGQTLNGWSRDVEHSNFLAQLGSLLEVHEADALVIAGDVFDGINPSGESQQMLYEALAGFRRRVPHLTTVMIAGNHDPAGRLEAPAAVLREIGVHVVGTMHRQGNAIDLGRHLVGLCDRAGDVRAHVLAIPFLRAADLPGLGLANSGGESERPAQGSPVVQATRRLYAEATAAALAHTNGLPLLATGHLHCSGAEESEGAERRILIGGEHAVPHDIFPAELAYVALGHLHRAQPVGRDSIRYSGSPFPLSSTELPYVHGVSLVEVGDAGCRAEHIPLTRAVPCLRLPETGALSAFSLDSALLALALEADIPRDRQPFVYVVAAPDRPTAGLASEVEQILDKHPVRCAGIKIDRPASGNSVAPLLPSTLLAECAPADLFELAFESEHGSPPETEHRTAFHEAESGG